MSKRKRFKSSTANAQEKLVKANQSSATDNQNQNQNNNSKKVGLGPNTNR